jgi:hypothetical protein
MFHKAVLAMIRVFAIVVSQDEYRNIFKKCNRLQLFFKKTCFSLAKRKRRERKRGLGDLLKEKK